MLEIYLAILLFLITVLIFIMVPLFKRNAELTLKTNILYMCVCAVLAVSVLFIPFRPLIIATVLFFAGPLYLFSKNKSFRNSNGKQVLSFAILPFTFCILLLIVNPNQKAFVFYPMLILGLSMGADLIVERYLPVKLQFAARSLKISESLIFFLSTVLILLLSERIGSKFLPQIILNHPQLIFIALFLTFTKHVSHFNSKVVLLPLLSAYWLFIFHQNTSISDVVILTKLLLVAGFIILSFKLNALTIKAALTAGLLALLIIIPKDIFVMMPLLIFFISGSLLSRLPVKNKNFTDIKFGNPRDIFQVLANGSIPVILLLIWIINENSHFLLAYIAAVSVAISDTSSSEIGTRYSPRAIDIFRLKRVETGVSGGISLIGSIFGLLAAFIFTVISLWLLELLTAFNVFLITSAGFFGNILDSLIGSLLQIKYRSRDDFIWRDALPDKNNFETRGIQFINNDMVNFLSILITILAFLLIISFCA